MQVMYGTTAAADQKRKIDIESSDIESLLADFLSEVLFISEVEAWFFPMLRSAYQRLCTLTAVLDGEPFDPAPAFGGNGSERNLVFGTFNQHGYERIYAGHHI